MDLVSDAYDNFDFDVVGRVPTEKINEAKEDVLELPLCSTEQILLRPNRLYRFIVMEDCARCKEMAEVYEVKS